MSRNHKVITELKQVHTNLSVDTLKGGSFKIIRTHGGSKKCNQKSLTEKGIKRFKKKIDLPQHNNANMIWKQY